jgi:CBS-domain-containing membrane protein
MSRSEMSSWEMSRRDMYLDAMLRHLGASYYDSLHGRAAPADVTRAVDQVAERLGEQPVTATPVSHLAGGQPTHHTGRPHPQVRDVMTTSVVTVDRLTGYKEIARLLVEHKISGMPVLALGRQVAGVVSEGDLIAARDKRPGRGGWAGWLRLGAGRDRQHTGLTAGELMTAPAVTIHPDATVAAAARVLSAHHVSRLPVVDAEGKLAGLVSRRDLLSLFLRPDADITHQVGRLLADILPTDPDTIQVAVRHGVVTLTGQLTQAGQQDLAEVAERLTRDIDGVVDVINKIGSAPGGKAGRDEITR